MSDQQRPTGKGVTDLTGWGRQTIAFAMSLRALDLGKSIDSPAQAAFAKQAAEETAQKLWGEAFNECEARPVTVVDIWQPFTRKVFAWASKHLES